ncbi:cytochrome P450 [Lipingzhangella sp. LS1_29]|uniref:Cytochrome P450 n=1 Tax=Lipingzhangella rawalii TaxID=2055835 RepID=A0ABU2H5S9_9ACTN|nr:cytochrome P450 [Lipingzhangella rawalii]MDS1270204.1 cytochrome P450 [Lipingzhangella rawalii]
MPPGYPEHTNATRLYGPQITGDTNELYTRIRQEHGPVAPVLLDGDIPAWFVLGYREIQHVTSNSQLFARDCRRWNLWDHIPSDWPLLPYVGWTPSVMFAEGEEHRRRAGALGDALDALDRAELVTICNEIAEELVETFAEDGTAELISQYAHQIPAYVVARIFGLPKSDIPQLVRDVLDSLDTAEGAAAAHQRVHDRLHQLVADRQQRRRRDVPSRLLDHPAGLTFDEIVIDLLVVMAAAQAPTGNWIGNTLRLMFTDDTFSTTVQGGRSSATEALNEVLWKQTPTQNFIGRWATQRCELAGRRIQAGDLLVLGFAAANTDPQVQPGQPTGSGENRAQMSFGGGEHGCPFPAPELARIIATSAIEVLLDHLPDVELSVAEDELEWRPSVWMRGLFELPVQFTPAPPTT